MSIFVRIIAVVFLYTLFAISAGAAANEGSGSPTALGILEEPPVTMAEITPLNEAEVNVAVPQGGWWTDEVVNYLNTLPDKSATPIPPNAPLSTLRNFDALVVYGNVTVDGDAVLQWVNEGGRLVITPWSLTNYSVHSIGFTAAEPSLPASNPHYMNDSITDVYTNPLNISLLLPEHQMVKDILFGSESVGYERGSVGKPGATEIATWNDAYTSTAITYWEYGDGVVVYLNMHYITSDCDRAIWYNWGKELLANAIQFKVVIPVSVDIKPGSCPNPLNLKSKGVLPVAVLGTEDFDVTKIDPLTILLSREGVEEGVAPIRSDYEDVATPFEGELCDCHNLNGDGYLDLTLKFETQLLVETLGLGEVAGETIPLTLTGNLRETEDGTPIEGKDCVLILDPKGK